MVGLVVAGASRAAMPGPRVECHYTYGGEEKMLVASPVASPYRVQATQVGSYFRLRVVFQQVPRDQASVKVYVYADREEGLVPLHQATWIYPAATRGTGPHGFTGLHHVYEPVRDGELQYWCDLKTPPAARP
jgi:hypothetical protein